MKIISSMCFVILFIASSTYAAGNGIWEYKSGVSPSDLWNASSNNLLSTDTFVLPRGGNSLVMYFNVDGNLWRCFDNHDIAMRLENSVCYVLKKK